MSTTPELPKWAVSIFGCWDVNIHAEAADDAAAELLTRLEAARYPLPDRVRVEVRCLGREYQTLRMRRVSRWEGER